MQEAELRKESLQWLRRRYAQADFYIPLTIFHDKHMTLAKWLRRKYKGEELSRIPKYASLAIRPDLVGLLNSKSSPKLWLIGECKVGSVGVGDFRQAIHYANVANAYEGFLFFEGLIATDVKQLINRGEHRFLGTNARGRIASRRLRVVEYRHSRLAELTF